MNYDLKNVIFYDNNKIINKKIYYMVNSFNEHTIFITNIKKLPSDVDYELVNLDELRKNHINILYEGKNKND